MSAWILVCSDSAWTPSEYSDDSGQRCRVGSCLQPAGNLAKSRGHREPSPDLSLALTIDTRKDSISVVYASQTESAAANSRVRTSNATPTHDVACH